MIYGDYDVDGITATALLYMVLNKLGSQVDYYLPNRLVEGYGLSTEGIDEAKKKGVTLIVTVDTGITAVEEVEYATSSASMWLSLITTNRDVDSKGALDHQSQAARLRLRRRIVGRWCRLQVRQALYRRLEKDESELDEHLDLVALGTSADIVPLVGENRVLTNSASGRLPAPPNPA